MALMRVRVESRAELHKRGPGWSTRGLLAGLGVRGIDGLRLRGSLLPKEDRQHDDRQHREKFALPVLKRLEPEARRAHVLPDRDMRRPTVLRLFLLVHARAADRV